MAASFQRARELTLLLRAEASPPAAACSSPADSAPYGSWTNRESLVSRRIHRTPCGGEFLTCSLRPAPRHRGREARSASAAPPAHKRAAIPSGAQDDHAGLGSASICRSISSTLALSLDGKLPVSLNDASVAGPGTAGTYMSTGSSASQFSISKLMPITTEGFRHWWHKTHPLPPDSRGDKILSCCSPDCRPQQVENSLPHGKPSHSKLKTRCHGEPVHPATEE